MFPLLLTAFPILSIGALLFWRALFIDFPSQSSLAQAKAGELERLRWGHRSCSRAILDSNAHPISDAEAESRTHQMGQQPAVNATDPRRGSPARRRRCGTDRPEGDRPSLTASVHVDRTGTLRRRAGRAFVREFIFPLI